MVSPGSTVLGAECMKVMDAPRYTSCICKVYEKFAKLRAEDAQEQKTKSAAYNDIARKVLARAVSCAPLRQVDLLCAVYSSRILTLIVDFTKALK